MASVIGLSTHLRCLGSSYCVNILPQCALNDGCSPTSVWENVSMSSTYLLFAEGGLVLHVFLHPQFIFDLSGAVLVVQFLP